MAPELARVPFCSLLVRLDSRVALFWCGKSVTHFFHCLFRPQKFLNLMKNRVFLILACSMQTCPMNAFYNQMGVRNGRKYLSSSVRHGHLLFFSMWCLGDVDGSGFCNVGSRAG